MNNKLVAVLAVLLTTASVDARATPSLLGSWQGTWNDYAGLSSGGGTETFVITTESGSNISGYFDWVCNSPSYCGGGGPPLATYRETFTGTVSGNSLALRGIYSPYLGTLSLSGDSITGTWAFYSAPNVPLGPWAVTRVPEPATVGLLGLGLAAIGFARRRRAASV